MDHSGMDIEHRAALNSTLSRKPKRILPIILAIAVLLIALIIYGGVSAFHLAEGTASAAAAVASRFVAAMGVHDYQAASVLAPRK